ncbi:hypothetical protein N7451_012470 [Penicillium sp. IBT 35674x]|nr:hypothetical protein N7451_012470 [Penicillium sp. IBT 35674x]
MSISQPISAGRHCNLRSSEGDHIAAQKLVRHAGINIDYQSSYNDAPLLLAVKRLSRQQSILIVESLLLCPDLDVNIPDPKGEQLYGMLLTIAIMTS